MTWRSQPFLTSGTFTPDTGVSLVYVTEIAGGGGGGGIVRDWVAVRQVGGGAGELVVGFPVNVTPGVGCHGHDRTGWNRGSWKQ